MLPSVRSFNQMHNIATLVKTYRHTKGEQRSVQEMKRIILRSIALKYLMKTYFGKGVFSWQDTHQIYTDCLRALDKFSLPRPLFDLVHIEHNPVTGRLAFVTPAKILEDLRASSSDPNELLEAKREAIVQFIAQKLVGLTTGRMPSYREDCDPNQTQSNLLPKTASKEFMQEAMRPVIEILETHLPHCDPHVRKALKHFIINPDLPFDVELPA
jgi:hypothetical protein